METNTSSIHKEGPINTFKFLKWSSGESYERTIRKTCYENQVSTSVEERNNNSQKLVNIEKKTKMKKKVTFNNTEFTRFSNKRNSQNEKLLQRDPIIQTNINPFIQRTSYVEHIDKEDEFLRPKDSNIEYDL